MSGSLAMGQLTPALKLPGQCWHTTSIQPAYNQHTPEPARANTDPVNRQSQLPTTCFEKVKWHLAIPTAALVWGGSALVGGGCLCYLGQPSLPFPNLTSPTPSNHQSAAPSSSSWLKMWETVLGSIAHLPVINVTVNFEASLFLKSDLSKFEPYLNQCNTKHR